MVCCMDCFALSEPKDWIRSWGKTGSCDFCGANLVATIEAAELQELFAPLLDYYEVREYGTHYLDPGAEITGETLAFLLQDEWGLFNEDRLTPENIEQLLQQILPDVLVLDSWLTVRDRWYAEPDAEKTQWQLFARHLQEKRRFIPDVDNEELGAVISKLPVFLEEATAKIPAGRPFYRSRIGYSHDKRRRPRPYPPSKMGAPPPSPDRSGRANPPGISYLYAASDKTTAISEKRPARGTILSLARLIPQRDLIVIDLADLPALESPFVESLSYELNVRDFLSTLGHELSRPISSEDPPLEYLPSQYLCEVILALGYDGVIYTSSYSNGSNIVLFDPATMRIARPVKLVQVGGISVDLEQNFHPTDLADLVR